MVAPVSGSAPRQQTTRTEAPAPRPAVKPAAPKDRVEHRALSTAEKESIRQKARAEPAATTEKTARPAPVQRESAPVKAALGAQNDLRAAEKKLADVQRAQGKGADVAAARKELATAKSAADKLTSKALSDVTQPAKTAIKDSAAAQKSAKTANDHVDTARNTLEHLERSGASESHHTHARENLLTAETDARKANGAAANAGDDAIASQREANRVAEKLGRPAPFPAARDVRDMQDVARLTPEKQAAILGAPSGVNARQAAEATADRKAVNAHRLDDKATKLEGQASAAREAADTADTRLKAATDAVTRANEHNASSSLRMKVQEDLTQARMEHQTAYARAGKLEGEAKEARSDAQDAKLEANRAADSAGLPHPFPARAPSAADIKRIVSDDDPVRRNAHITQGYHDLSNQTAELLGRDNANWLTFGQHASFAAGQGIQGKLPLNEFEQHAAGPAGVHTDEIRKGLAQGNKEIFEHIAPHFARFNEAYLKDPSWRNDPRRDAQMMQGFLKDTPRELHQAFKDYHSAMLLNAGPHTPETDRQRAQLMYKANVEVAHVEQVRADKQVDRAVPSGNKLGSVGSHIMGNGSVAQAATDKIFLQIGDEKVYVSRDMKHAIPGDLKTIDDKGLRDDVKKWNDGKDVNDRSYSDADNWRSVNERMGFISQFFRAYQQGVPDLWNAPHGVEPTKI